MDVIDVAKRLAEHPEGRFLTLASFNGHAFGTCCVTGVSPVWEMHPDTDEFFYVIEGTVVITLLEEEPRDYVAEAGSAFVVPRGIWHRPGAPDGASFVHFTPGTSLHSDLDDPRVPPAR